MATGQLDVEGDIHVDLMDNVDEFEVQNNQNKDIFLEQLVGIHKELERRQRKYKKTLQFRYKARKDTIIEKSHFQATERLRLERNDIRAQNWVADSITCVRENNAYLDKIQCHVNCQDKLSERIKALKHDIVNMEHGIQFLNKQIYELNLKTVPDSQFQDHVARERKKLALLENRLEVGISQESVFTAHNASMREKINNILYERQRFNATYTKLMQSLTSDKKYLMDMIECSLGVFENCIDAHDKIEFVLRKHNKENDARKIDAQSTMRNKAATEETENFLSTKSKARQLNDLQPKEFTRRQSFRHYHNNKIQLYNNVLAKLLKYSGANSVREVTDIFQQQESLYYSYFSYANEVGYHVTLLDNSVNRLYFDVESLRTIDKQNISDQKAMIAQLEAELQEKKHRNSKLIAKKESQDRALERLFNAMTDIVKMCRLNTTPLLNLLGDHSHVKLSNINHFTKLLEKRVINVVANVYCMERKDTSKPANMVIVKDIEKIMEPTTDLQDIVLTQQCPECAEGEANNMDEMTDNGVLVQSVEEVKHNLLEKVNQPEMQYRLHNISQCRLPRSRLLAAKRNMS